jgi:hypothetical protein
MTILQHCWIFNAFALYKCAIYCRGKDNFYTFAPRNYGRLAEWLGSGLQNRVRRFESATDLHNFDLWCNGSTADSGSVCLSSSLSRSTSNKALSFVGLTRLYCFRVWSEWNKILFTKELMTLSTSELCQNTMNLSPCSGVMVF